MGPQGEGKATGEGVNSLKQIAKKINYLKVAQIVLGTTLILAPLVTYAALPGINCSDLNGVNCQATTVNGLIKTVINWLLGIAFGIAVLFLIVGGFWYITSSGNEEQVEKGKSTAINAIIGIVIIILSYVIITVVSNLVSNTSTGP